MSFGKDRNSNNVKKIALAGTLAAVAGYVVGVLTAPKSGRETRKDLKNAADKGYLEAEKELKKLNTELSNVVAEAKKSSSKLSAKAQKELDNLVQEAKDTKEKAREMISAVRDGEAEDADLNKAVKQANTALRNLRNYLKK